MILFVIFGLFIVCFVAYIVYQSIVEFNKGYNEGASNKFHRRVKIIKRAPRTTIKILPYCIAGAGLIALLASFGWFVRSITIVQHFLIFFIAMPILGMVLFMLLGDRNKD